LDGQDSDLGDDAEFKKEINLKLSEMNLGGGMDSKGELLKEGLLELEAR